MYTVDEKPDNYMLSKSGYPDAFVELKIVIEIKVSDI